MKIKYSIIIPHYNSEDTLDRLLSSIPQRANIEVLVIDDRSNTKDYEKVAKAHGTRLNIKTFLNSGTKSAGTCRNIGLDNAKGRYIIFSDSDDFFVDGFLDFLDKDVDNNPSTDIFFYNVTSLDENNNLGHRHKKNSALVLNYIHKRGRYSEEKLRLTHNVPWGKVFRGDFLRQNNIFFDETIASNDGMFSLKAGKYANKIFCSEKILYCVTQSPNSLTRQRNIIHYRTRLSVYARYFNFLSASERKKIAASPVPLLRLGLTFGPRELLRSIYFLKKNNVQILRYFNPFKYIWYR